MSKPDREEARQRKLEWYRQNYQAIQADPERRAKLQAQKSAARARRRAKLRAEAKADPKPPATVNAEVLRNHGPWAPLFSLQAAA